MNKITLFGEEWEEITRKEYEHLPFNDTRTWCKADGTLKYLRKVKPKMTFPQKFGRFGLTMDGKNLILYAEDGFLGMGIFRKEIKDLKELIAYAEKFSEQEQNHSLNQKHDSKNDSLCQTSGDDIQEQGEKK